MFTTKNGVQQFNVLKCKLSKNVLLILITINILSQIKPPFLFNYKLINRAHHTHTYNLYDIDNKWVFIRHNT